MKTSEMFKISFTIKTLTLVVLHSVSWYQVIIGPLNAYFENRTITRENHINLDEGREDVNQVIEWPSLSICKTPFYKNELKYQEFMSKIQNNDFDTEEQFEALRNETFFTHPKDFILALGYGNNYTAAIENVTRIPIKEPYIKVVLSDYIYSAFCAIVSFKELSVFLPKKEKYGDFSFYFILYLNGENIPADGDFVFKLLMDEEDIFIGAETVSGISVDRLVPKQLGIYTLTYSLDKSIRKCDQTERMTPCVMKYYNNLYDGNDYETDFYRRNAMAVDFFRGYEELASLTGCKRPCEETKFHVQKYRTMQTHFMPDRQFSKFLRDTNDTTSAQIVINHQRQKTVIQHEEIMDYGFVHFLSDTGGIIGLWIGLSFWGLYQDVIEPIIQRLEVPFLKKRKSSS